jgi:hypothetical protein
MSLKWNVRRFHFYSHKQMDKNTATFICLISILFLGQALLTENFISASGADDLMGPLGTRAQFLPPPGRSIGGPAPPPPTNIVVGGDDRNGA